MHPEPRDRWRSRVKTTLASAIAGVYDHGLGAMLTRRPVRPLIVGYHRVVEDFSAAASTDLPSMLISRDMFERHVDWIGRHFTFVGLDEIGERMTRGVPFDEPVAAITFDDGYRDVYEHAYPVLQRRGIPAAIFVVTDLVGKPIWQHHDRLYRLVAKAYASWTDPRREIVGLLRRLDIPVVEQLGLRTATATTPLKTVEALLSDLSLANVGRVLELLESAVGNGFGPAPFTVTWPMLAELRRAGWVIGSHTETHPSLPTESADVVARELTRSKRELEHQLGQPIDHFAYPGGRFTRNVVDALHTAGYRFGYTACQHGDARYPSLTIERLLLWEGSSVGADGRFSADILNCQAHGLWPPARKCGVQHAW